MRHVQKQSGPNASFHVCIKLIDIHLSNYSQSKIIMEENTCPKVIRRKSFLKRAVTSSHIGVTGSPIDLDELIFKSPSVTPKRKRKRHRTGEEDCVSLQSVDITTVDEPKKRRRSSLVRMSSLTNLLSPVKPSAKKVGNALQKSLSLKNLMSPTTNKYLINAYKKPQPTPPKRRQSLFWYETVKSDAAQNCSTKELEKQEAIYELYKSEEDLIDDLKMVKSTYHDSMSKLKILSEEELKQIFGPITTLAPIHEELVDAMKQQRDEHGATAFIGQAILDWVPRLKEYVAYCANQVYARALFDIKKHEPAVDDFLQRCQDSPFSRRLDLWSFLDVPRSRLVKYPLLLKAILKNTPSNHEDQEMLPRACMLIEDIIATVDQQTGDAKCKFTREKLEYLDEKQKVEAIDESKVILCDGVLKNSRGTKLYVFLFDKVLVLTRLATRDKEMRYQVYRQPIPVDQLILDEMPNSQSSKSGSFKSAFTPGTNSKTSFRISLRDGGKGLSHTLHGNDEHDKRQWVQSIQSLIPKENILEEKTKETECNSSGDEKSV